MKKKEELRRDARAQVEREGVDTWQAAGRVRALETLRVTPSWALFLKAWQRQSGLVLTTVFSPEQHVFSGFSAVPPADTNGRQSTMFATKPEQSAAGAGAERAAEVRASTMHRSWNVK